MNPLLLVDALAIAGVLAAVMWLSGQTTSKQRKCDEGPGQAADSDSSLTSAEVTVAWAAGSRGEWDRHVRPVLAREFDNIVGARRSAQDRQRTGVLMFGDDLWPLVDPSQQFTSRRNKPGPGHPALSKILRRLEQA